MLGFAAVLAVACRDTVPTAESVVKVRPPIASVCIVGVTCQCLVTPSLCPLPNDTTVARGHLRLTCNVGHPLTPGDTLRCIARADIAVGGVRRLWFVAANGATVYYPPDSLPRDTVAWRFPVTGSGSVYAATPSDTVSIRVRVRTLRVICTPTAPVRGTIVHCVTSMSDSSAFTLTRLHSVVGNTTVADLTGTRPVPLTFDWKGRAAATTTVTINGLVNGQPMTATGTFSITSRIGVLAEWEPPKQPETPPSPTPASGKPILDDHYPGLRQITPDSVTALKGGLGHTYHLYPNWSGVVIPSGPNTGLAYVGSLAWKPNGPVSFAGIYISIALFPADPFYQKQIGGGTFCGTSDMDALRAGVYAHESQHYTRGVQTRMTLRTHENYESLVALVGARADPTVIGPIFESIRKQFDDAIQQSDSLIEQMFPVANVPSCRLRF